MQLAECNGDNGQRASIDLLCFMIDVHACTCAAVAAATKC